MHHAHQHGLKEPSSSSVGPVRHHFCSHENCSSQPARLRWTADENGTYCRYHATMKGLRERHMCRLCLDGESWSHEAAWAEGLCLDHALASGLQRDDSDQFLCRHPGCYNLAQSGRDGYCRAHHTLHRTSKRQNAYRATLDDYCDSAVERLDVGNMSVICQSCGSHNFEGEKIKRGQSYHFNLCCNNGKVKIDPLPDAPGVLRELLTENTVTARNFRNNIRAYNSALSFTSFGSEFDPAQSLPGHGPPVFRIHGSVYHVSGRLHPDNPSQAKYAQIYLYDHQHALNVRQGLNPTLRVDILADLQTMITELPNPYYSTFRMMDEVSEQCCRNNLHDVHLGFRAGGNVDKRRYNHPTVAEVAAVFCAEDGAPPENRDIVVWPREQPCFRMCEDNKNVDPMTYVLLLPHGSFGWHHELTHHRKTAANNRLTAGEFYAHKLMMFSWDNPLPHSGGLLFQQYIVDAYCRAESQRLNYLRTHQDDLRAELYSELVEAVQDSAFVPGVTNVGKRIVLPSSYPGSPRALHQAYLDCMTIVSHFGRPDLFVTFTANPRWPEIQRQLRFRETALGRPELVARVFKLKLNELLQDLLRDHVLGRVLAWSYVVEFQKRGLPHAHILLILAPECKPTTPAAIDQIVCAEFPDPNDPGQSSLFNTIQNSMVHGPCGPRNPTAPCMENGVCCKGFWPAKHFRPETSVLDSAYPLYRRRDDGRVIMKGLYEMDNRDIVPYNPSLCQKYDAHINVEIVASIKAVKYLFKYTFKGHDRAEIEAGVDEISDHINARYVGPAESAWRLFEFPLHQKSHVVVRLALHLPGQHMQIFSKGQEIEATQDGDQEKTTLTAWFELNRRDAAARRLLYAEVPEHYRWDRKTKSWMQRQHALGHKILGRIHAASPVEKDRFYLYLLLLHQRGATGWKDIAPDLDFRRAAEAKGLIDSDDEYVRAMEEAASIQMPAALRLFFVHMIQICELKDPSALWEQFADDLSADFMNQCNVQEVAHGLALRQIEENLHRLGSSLTAHHLPVPADNQVVSLRDREVRSALNYDISSELRKSREAYKLMRPDQSAVFDAVTKSLQEKKGGIFFVDGPGGSGKTFLENALLSHVRGQGDIALACAWSGIAATLLPGGRTCHVTFGLPVPLPTENPVSQLSAQSGRAAVLKQASLIIWDEASMSPKSALDAADMLLRDLTNIEAPFGGKVLLLAGDFRQVLPVIERASKEEILQQCICFHKYFTQKCVRIYSLEGNARTAAASDPAYAKFLLRLGNGQVPPCFDTMPEIIELPQQCNVQASVPVDDIIVQTYPDLLPAIHRCTTTDMSSSDVAYFKNRAILSPTNAAVRDITDAVLSLLRTNNVEITDYHSRDSIRDSTPATEQAFPLDFLHSLQPAGLPPHNLQLFPGAVVMLIRNIDTESGICNGVRAIIKRCLPRVLDLLIITGRAEGTRVYLPRIDLTTKSNEFPFILNRRQFPIRLSYGMTINKAQGQTLQFLSVYLKSTVFAHGQLYVALSRVGSFAKIRIYLDTDDDRQGYITSDGYSCFFTANVVWPEVLLEQSASSHPLAEETSKQTTNQHAKFPSQLQCSVDDTNDIELVDTSIPNKNLVQETVDSDLEETMPPSCTQTEPTVGDSIYHPESIEGITDAFTNAQYEPHDCEPYVLPKYDKPFQRQEEMRCGKHALNNALGGECFFTNDDMSQACDIFIEESHYPDAEGLPANVARRDLHEKGNGWYSVQVLGTALRHTAKFAMSEQPLRINPDVIYQQTVVGAVINQNNAHWFAIRYDNQFLWKMDSTEEEPTVLSYEEYVQLVHVHRHSYPIHRV